MRLIGYVEYWIFALVHMLQDIADSGLKDNCGRVGFVVFES